MLNVILIVLSFLVSTKVSVMIMRISRSKWLGALAALMINVLLLWTAYVLLYRFDEESRIFGIDFHYRYSLVVFIPVLTYMNVVWLTVTSRRKIMVEHRK